MSLPNYWWQHSFKELEHISSGSPMGINTELNLSAIPYSNPIDMLISPIVEHFMNEEGLKLFFYSGIFWDMPLYKVAIFNYSFTNQKL